MAARAEGAPTSRPAADAPAQRILAETRRILSDAKITWYSHKTIVDARSGTYAVDCSGLVCIILQEVAPQHLQNVPIARGEKRQRAVEFHDAFAAAPTSQPATSGWRRIERLADARPGDLLAWRHRTIVPGQNTGHIVVIDRPPVDEGHGVVRVAIIDSTSLLHGEDSRKAGTSGVGRGTMWFHVDVEGRPVAFRWASRTGRLVQYSIAIGRAVD
jgi:hypothetical protein